MAEKQTAVTVYEPSHFQLAQYTPETLQDKLSTFVAGVGGIRPQDFVQVRVPAGGSTTWEIPLATGDVSLKQLDGIVLYAHNARSYWKKNLDESGGKSAPNCASMDGLTGYGIPGGDCGKCPLAQFGTDRRGRGQACKAMMWAYILQPSGFLPLMLSIPPTGAKFYRDYVIKLMSSTGKAACEVLTGVTLERLKNADGTNYSRAVFSYIGDVPLQVAQLSQIYGKSIEAFVRATRPTVASSPGMTGEGPMFDDTGVDEALASMEEDDSIDSL